MKHLRWELRHTADPTCQRVFGGGGGSSDSKTNSPENTDRRAALQDAVQTGDGSTTGNVTIVSSSADAQVLQTLAETMPDAVRAMSEAGADVIDRAGGAVVDLTRDSIKANTMSFDHVVDFGAAAVDKLIDASTGLASAAMSSYAPPEKSNSDALKWGLIAAAGVAAAVVLGKVSK